MSMASGNVGSALMMFSQKKSCTAWFAAPFKCTLILGLGSSVLALMAFDADLRICAVALQSLL